MKILIFIIPILTTICFSVYGFGYTCSDINNVQYKSSTYMLVINSIVKYVNKFQSTKINIKKVWTINKIGKWILVEVEFDDLEPSIFVLKQNKNKFKVVAEFSGSTEKDEPREIIINSLSNQVPAAPKELFICYEPRIAPFISQNTKPKIK